MKTLAAVTMLTLAATPALASFGIDWLRAEDVERVAAGEDVELVASDVARREFTPEVTIDILDLERAKRIKGDLNATLRASPGNEYVTLTLHFANHGRVPVSAFTHHFTAEDDAGVKYRPIWGLPDRIDAWNLKRGASADGILSFEVPAHTTLTLLVWEGEMGATQTEI